MQSEETVQNKLMEDDILSYIGAQSLSDEQKAQIYQTMLETIRYRALDTIVERLTEQQLAEWRKIVDEGDEIAINQYLVNNNIDFIEIMLNETLKYKIEVKSLTDYLKNSQKSFDEIKVALNSLKG